MAKFLPLKKRSRDVRKRTKFPSRWKVNPEKLPSEESLIKIHQDNRQGDLQFEMLMDDLPGGWNDQLNQWEWRLEQQAFGW